MALSRRHDELAPLFEVKRQFVQRRAATRITPEEAQALDGAALERELRRAFRRALRRAHLRHARRRAGSQDEAAHADELDLALRYAAGRCIPRRAASTCARGVLFKAPAQVRSAAPAAARARRSRCRARTAYRIDPDAPAPARRLRAHRPGHQPRRRARPGQLLHLVPRAGQGLVLAAASREKPSPAAPRRSRSRRARSA